MYNEDVINEIGSFLLEHEKTISAAESVTSGHLQAALSTGIDASLFLQGGITVYNAAQKTRHLNIEPVHAQKVNCVDAEVAANMAIEVNKMFLSDYGVSITGYASIVPQCEDEGLHAYFALALKDEVILSERITSKAENGFPAQADFACQVMQKIADYLKQQKKHP